MKLTKVPPVSPGKIFFRRGSAAFNPPCNVSYHKCAPRSIRHLLRRLRLVTWIPGLGSAGFRGFRGRVRLLFAGFTARQLVFVVRAVIVPVSFFPVFIKTGCFRFLYRPETDFHRSSGNRTCLFFPGLYQNRLFLNFVPPGDWFSSSGRYNLLL